MHFHLPLRRALLALAACAAVAATPAAAQRADADEPVPVRLPRVADWTEATPRLQALFPPAAREAGATGGNAWMQFRVMTDSTVDPASITVDSVSRPAFAQAAREWAARTRFVPATVGDRPVAAWMRYIVTFLDPQAPAQSEAFGGTGYTSVQPEVLLNAGELPELVAAHYPAAMREAGEPGAVLVSFPLSATGEVDADRINVLLWTHPALEEPARAVVRMLRFSPPRVNGRPKRGSVSMPLHFGTGDSSGQGEAP